MSESNGSTVEPTVEPTVEVVDVPEQGWFEIRVDGTRAGLTQYADDGGERLFPHTEVDDAHAGQGLSTRLIREALDATRAAGLAVLPQCSAVQHFIAKHDDYVDLVPAARRADFGL